jgi:hypothetical protein
MRGCDVCWVYAFLFFSRLPSETSTITHKHILQANLMFAFRQTAVVGFSRISGSSSSRKRTWHHFFIPHASFHHCGGFCCKSLKSLWLTPTSEPGHFFYLRPETLSMYRREFPEHVSANKSIFACWCWLCSSNRQVAVCTFRSKADSFRLVSWNSSLRFCQISCARTFCYIDCKCNVRHPEAILLHLCKVSIRFFDCGAGHVSTFAFRS